MNRRRTCLTCTNWRRHADKMMGSCIVAAPPEPSRFRFQHEDCTEGLYQFGEQRTAATITHSKELPLVDGSGKEIANRVCAYYDAPWPVGVER